MAEQIKVFSVKVDGIDTAIKELNNLEVALTANRSRKKELLKIQKTEVGLSKDQKTELDKLNKTIHQQTYEKGVLNKTVKQGVKELNSENSSIDALQSKVSRLTSEWSGLSKAQRENTKKGKALSAEIEKTNAKIKEQKEGVGDNTSSIGNYKDSINAALKENGLYSGSLGRLIGKYSTAKESLVKLKDSTNKSTEATEGGTASTKGMTAAQKAQAFAVRSSAKSFNVLKIALIGIGIGVLLIAIGALVTYFTKTKRGAESLSRTMIALGAGIAVITDRISTFGSAIANFFSGEGKAAMEDLKNTFGGVGEEIRKETKAAYDSEKALQALTDRARKFSVEKKKVNAQVKEARLLARDEEVSTEERLRQINKAIELQKKLSDTEIALAKERYEQTKIQINQGESLEEDFDTLAELEGAAFEAIAARADALRTLGKDKLLLERKEAKEKKDIIKDQKAIADAALKEEADRFSLSVSLKEESLKQFAEYTSSLIKKEKEAEDRMIDDAAEMMGTAEMDEIILSWADETTEVDAWIASWRDAQALVSGILEHQDFFDKLAEKQEALQAARDKNLISEEKYKDASIEIEKEKNRAILGITADVIGDAANVFEEKTVAYKALASAEALINTYLAATAAYASMAVVPIVGPILAPIAAATAIATGLKSVAKINSVELGRGGELIGNSHENGGIPISVDGQGGYEGEGGEIVINKYAARANRAELSRINSSAGRGVKFATGGELPSVNKNLGSIIDLSDKTIKAIINGINDKKVINDPIETLRYGIEQQKIEQIGDF